MQPLVLMELNDDGELINDLSNQLVNWFEILNLNFAIKKSLKDNLKIFFPKCGY